MNANNTENFVGIVVRAEKSREADIRVRLLTAEGSRTLTATGALKQGAKLTNAVQLFTLAEFSAVGQKLIGAHVMRTNHEITKDIKKYYLACAICEVVNQLYHVEHNDNVFLLTANALAILSAQNPAPDVPAPPNQPDIVRQVYTEYFTALLIELGYDIDADQDINTAYMRHLDIKIPNTTLYLV